MSDLWGPIQGGAIAGLVIAVLVGPVFFALIQISLHKGFLAGVTFAIGIFLSDASYFSLSYFGIASLAHSRDMQTFLGIAGGGFLIIFGLTLARRKVSLQSGDTDDVKSNTLVMNIVKGFLMNSINPGVLFYWLAVVSAATVKFNSSQDKIFAFFITTMIMVFSTDILKAYLAARLKKVINSRLMTWLNRVSGSVLMIVGGKLFFDAILPFIHIP